MTLSPSELSRLMSLRNQISFSQRTWRDFTEAYFPGHSQTIIKNAYHRERRKRGEGSDSRPDGCMRPSNQGDSDDESIFSTTSDSPGPNLDGTLDEDSDVREDHMDCPMEESEDGLEEEEILEEKTRSCRSPLRDKQTTDERRDLPLDQLDRRSVEQQRTSIASQIESNTAFIKATHQGIMAPPKQQIKRIVCTNSGPSRQGADETITVQPISLPSPLSETHSPNRPSSKRRKRSTDESDSNFRIAQCVLGMDNAASSRSDPTNADLSLKIINGPDNTISGRTPPLEPDYSGSTTSQVEVEQMHDMLRRYKSFLSELVEKAERSDREKRRADRLQADRSTATQQINELLAQLDAERSRSANKARLKRIAFDAKKAANELRSQLDAQKAETERRIEHITIAAKEEAVKLRTQLDAEKLINNTQAAEKAETESIARENLRKLEESKKNEKDLKAAFEEALDQINEKDRELRESRQDNIDKTKLLESIQRNLEEYHQRKDQAKEILLKITQERAVLELSFDHVESSVRRQHSGRDWDIWPDWKMAKYGEMHVLEKIKGQQSLSALRDAKERLGALVGACGSILPFLTVESGAAE